MTVVSGWKRAFDEDDAVIYLLDGNLTIARCNPAWDRFALANKGHSAVSSKVVGTNLMDVVPPVLQDFYLAAYSNVRQFRRDWWHVFECSSADLTRLFQMRILPTEQDGLLTINTLINETAAEAGLYRNAQDYADQDGIVTMCSHCRRVKSLGRQGIWDWVPALLLSGTVLTKFGLCGFCTAYHYHSR